MTNKENIPDFNAIAEKIFKDLPRITAITALNFFKESFEKQGFTDVNFQPWQARKGNTREGGAILVQTGNLRDSTRIASATMQKVEISNEAPYAKVHNNGGIISVPVTEKSRKFFWLMYKSTNNIKWKYMALTKKKRMSFEMPKRQFIGNSETLNKQLDEIIVNQILKNFQS